MLRILVVDDEIPVAKALARCLRMRRCDVQTAQSGDDALSRVEIFGPDIVISDFRMFGMNGIELLAEIKRRAPHVVRVLMSGYANVGDKLSADFCLFLAKPWDDDTLVGLLSGVKT